MSAPMTADRKVFIRVVVGILVAATIGVAVYYLQREPQRRETKVPDKGARAERGPAVSPEPRVAAEESLRMRFSPPDLQPPDIDFDNMEPPPEPPDESFLPQVPLTEDRRRHSSTIRIAEEGGDRVAAARIRAEPAIRELFLKAGVEYPADYVYLRGFKREGELELWVRNGRTEYRLVETYAVMALSGQAGPKRKEGDFQVPEGFYEVDRFNPESNFHLSLGLNYPNASDRVLSDPEKPGSNIFIHGNAVSAGCLAMGDDRIEEIYLAALDARKRPVSVHIFPGRMNSSDWQEWETEQTTGRPELAGFWRELRVGFDAFERDRMLPRISVKRDGSYRVGL